MADARAAAVLASSPSHTVPSTAPRTPLLLTVPRYGGTLAAARCLGSRGVPVTMAGGKLLDPARWSRHVVRRVESPDAFDAEAFLSWLLDFGRREPEHVLYPTCDDLAWLFAANAEELGKYFRLYQPSAKTLGDILDKKRLARACQAAGIAVVATQFPEDRAQAIEIAARLAFPLLLKPRTQVQLPQHGKGVIVERREQFVDAYDRFVDTGWPPASAAALPGVEMPMLQEYLPQAGQGIYSMAGFIGRGERQVAVRASQKILQRPRRVGVGLCFDEAPVDQALLDKLVRMCRAVGYFGVFEAEFVRHDGQLRLIDFNPRFYGQMGFEVARRLPLGYLAWLGAMGDEEAIDREIALAREWQEGNGYAYCDRFFLNVVLLAQGLSGGMAWSEVRHWRAWQRERRSRALMVDAARRVDDRAPGMAATASELWSAVRHPRSFVKNLLQD